MKVKPSTKAKFAALAGITALLAALGGGMPQRASALGSGDADMAINGFNSAFLVGSGSHIYYKVSINNGNEFGGNFAGEVGQPWEASLDIMAEEDAFDRSGSTAHQTTVNNLCASWLQDTPPGSTTTPWSWDGWNDDLGWMTMALARGYQITGNTSYLTAAANGFNYAYNRGWDTQHNGGGIWEQNPDYTTAGDKVDKETLANNSLGIVACLLYQSTHDNGYLNRAKQIYAWERATLYEPNTGKVYTGIDRSGTVDQSAAVYNQGTFVDYANYLYQITGDVSYYNDAKMAVDFTKNNLTVGGVLSNSAGYLDTWADTFARGLGHFVRDNHQWAAYYPWMVQNANAVLNSRRTDYNITWNGWNQATPVDNNAISTKFTSAVAWLQFTPATQPSAVAGVHVIASKLNGIAIDSGGGFTTSSSNLAKTILWGASANNLNQKWLFSQNADTSWNIVSESSWQALDVPGGAATNNLQMIQWPLTRASNQRWWVDQQSDGSYKIWNQASGLALDSSSTSKNGFALTQWPWKDQVQQHWVLR